MVRVWFLFFYRYIWDFGIKDVVRVGGFEVTFIYWDLGFYVVMVFVFNNILVVNDSAFVEV